MSSFPFSFYIFFAACLFGSLVAPLRKRRSLVFIIVQITLGAAVLAAGFILCPWDKSLLLFHILFFAALVLGSFLLFLKPLVALPPCIVFLLFLIILYSPYYLKTDKLNHSKVRVEALASGSGVLLRTTSPSQQDSLTEIYSSDKLYFICGRVHYEPWLFFKRARPWFFCGYTSSIINPAEMVSEGTDRLRDQGFGDFLNGSALDRPGIRMEYRFLGPFPVQENYNYTLIFSRNRDPVVIEN